MLSRTWAGTPRSVMKTGPSLAAFLARLVSWLNSRLDSVVMCIGSSAASRYVTTFLQSPKRVRIKYPVGDAAILCYPITPARVGSWRMTTLPDPISWYDARAGSIADSYEGTAVGAVA